MLKNVTVFSVFSELVSQRFINYKNAFKRVFIFLQTDQNNIS
jgi:hypothetical protein